MIKKIEIKEKHKEHIHKSKSKRITGLMKYWHTKSIMISVIASSAIVATIVLMTSYPLAIKEPIARFILYSMTMMLPTLIISAISYPLKLPISQTTYLIATFIIYFLAFYATLHFYKKQATREKKIRYIIMIIVYALIFLIASVAYLMKSFYG